MNSNNICRDPVKATVFFLFVIYWFIILVPKHVYADVVTDGSVGPTQALSGPDFLISDALGTTKGANLFHSFQNFSITRNQSATFTGPDSISNVISRVTGGEISCIDGLLRSQVGQADFFFINPSGIFFGPNAVVDVPAAFHVSTAGELRFENGDIFSALSPDTSTLSITEPVSFGFVGAQPVRVEVNGTVLTFNPEATVSLSSGDITIQGTDDQNAELQSPGGQIRLTAVGTKAGDVSIRDGLSQIEDMDGKLILDAAKVDASGKGGGHVVAESGTIEMNAATLSADNTGDNVAHGGINLTADDTFTLTNASRVQSNVLGNGDAGGIRLEAENLRIEQADSQRLTGIFSEVEPGAAGNAGKIELNVAETMQIAGAGVVTSSTYGSGNAGSVQVRAGDLLIDGKERSIAYRDNTHIAGISSETDAISSGNANAVSVMVENSLSLLNGCGIDSYSSGTGNADSVIVNAETLKIDGGLNGNFTFIASNAYSDTETNTRAVAVTIENLMEMVNGAQIFSSPPTKGYAGSVSVHAGELKIDGQGSESFTGIASNTYFDEGHAGSVDITIAGLMELINGVEISSSTWSKGDAGRVSVHAGELKIDGQGSEYVTGISSIAEPDSEGDAGSVEITIAGLMELINGAQISSGTWSKGDAGSVTVQAGELKIDSQGSLDFTGLASDAEADSVGNGGSVAVTIAGLMELINGAQISSSTFAKGNAGSVTVHADGLKIDGQGSGSFTGIASKAKSDSEGHAGSVEITIAGLMELINGASISSDTRAKGNAGSVTIHAGELRIDRQGSEDFTGIASDAEADSEGHAGAVEITVAGLMELINRAEISSSTWSTGDAGRVTIHAGELKIDGQGSGFFTGIASNANSGEGHAGSVEITVADLMELINGAEISSSTWSKGNAGRVSVQAGELKVDGEGSGLFTGIASNANSGEGHAGSVEITIAGLMELINRAEISSSTWSQGDAGRVSVHAGELKMDSQGSGFFTGIASNANFGEGHAGSVEITIAGLMELINRAEISSSTWSKGDAGSVTVHAGEVKIDGQGSGFFTGIASNANFGEGHAGSVEITISGLLELINGAQISSSTWSKGDAGSVAVHAGELKIDRQGSWYVTGIGSTAEADSEGDAGSVEITISGLLELINGAQISSSTWSKGDAGSVAVHAGELKIDRQGSWYVAGIGSTAEADSEGDAGSVEITISGLLELINGAQISSSTFAKGDAGSVAVHAGELKIDRQGSWYFTGIGSTAEADSEGQAGSVEITIAGLMELINGAQISSSTFAKGDAGSVAVHAGELKIDGQGSDYVTGIGSTASSGGGKAGSVEITIAGLMELINGAQISSSTWSKGDAGSVVVHAGELKMDRQGSWYVTGIGSTAEADSEGHAGSVEITIAGLMELINGATISSSTFAKGNAGSVTVNAKRLDVNGETSGIYSAADNTSTGYVGDVTINADTMDIMNGGKISISAFQTLSDERLSAMPQNSITINANNLKVDQDAEITAESSINVPSGAINILANKTIIQSNSRINTSSNDADGGPITIQGKSIFLNDGLITTSVSGETGDGGDIAITGFPNGQADSPADALVMKGGFIQANTGADLASGGNIIINSSSVVVDAGGELQVGGEDRQAFVPSQKINVIQAAAPDGEQGVINITAPEVDISNSITNAGAYFADPAQLATDPCLAVNSENANALVQGSRGGLPEDPQDPSSVSFTGQRLNRLLIKGN